MKRLAAAVLLALALSVPASAHIVQGEGAGLQLYSYRMLGIAPKIDGTVDGAWGGASMREIILTDRTPAQVWFMNNDEFLFAAVRYAHSDGGSGNGLILYFDEGGNTGLMVDDGPHDDEISNPEAGARNEDAVAVRLAGGQARIKNLSWDGNGWNEDRTSSPDLQAAATYKNGVYTWELQVPLDNLNDDNRDGSDLDVGSTDEIGLLLEVVKDGEGKGSWFWDQTNRQPGNAVQGAGWADLQLGFDTRAITLYATMALGGAPEVDGAVTSGSKPDKAWDGAFRRDIHLTNFQGTRLRATVRFVDVPAAKALFAGITVYDRTENNDDYCMVFQEENSIVPSSQRNMALDAGRENALKVAGETATDLTWDGTAWTADAETPVNQAAAGRFYPLGGIPRYEYEFTLLKNGGSEDLQLKDGAGLGFLIHYHDADMPAGKQDFYWEYGANTAGTVTDSGVPAVAAGWPLLQSGAPSFQVVSPADDATVGGGYVLRVYAGAAKGTKDIASVTYKVRGEESWKEMNRVAGSDEWTAVWKTNDKPDGEYTVLFEGRAGLGAPLVTRAVNVEVKNARIVSQDPEVKISTPRGGETVYGSSYIVNFTARAVSPRTVATTQFGVDGGPWSLTSSATSHHWNSTGLTDGAHYVRIRVTDSEGASAVSDPVQVQVDNSAPAAVATVAPERIKDGDEMTFTAAAGVPGLSAVVPVAELKKIDSGARADLVLKDAAGNGVYAARYTVSRDNSVPDGIKTFRFRIRDAQGNAYDAPAEVTVDNTAPEILSLVCSDADNIYRNGETVRLGITCDAPGYAIDADFSALDNAYAVSTVAISSAGNGGQAAYTVSPANTLAPGKYTVTVTVTDAVGLTSRKSIDLFLDNDGPVISSAKTADADAVLTADDRLLVEAKDAQHAVVRLEYFVDVPGVPGSGTELKPADNGFAAALPVSGLAQGRHIAIIRGRDTAGNDGPAITVPFTVDTDPPVLEDVRVTYPDGSPAADGQRIVISARVYDAVSAVARVTALAGGVLASGTAVMADSGKNGDEVAGDRMYTAVIVPDKKTDGPATVTVSADDAVGNNVQSAAVPVLMDNAMPAVTGVKVVSPDDIFRNGETVLLTVAADAAGYRGTADFSAVDNGFRPGAAVVSDNGDKTYAVAYTLTDGNTVTDGAYDVKVTLADASGNTGTGTVQVVLDNTGPQVTGITFKDADTVLAADDAVTVTVTDAQTAVTASEVFVDAVREPGTGVTVVPQKAGFEGGQGTAPVALAGLGEGRHVLYARARDAAGTWGRVTALPFTVDRAAPEITVLSAAYPAGRTAVCDGQDVVFTVRVRDVTGGLGPDAVLLDAGALNGTAKKVVMKDDGTGADAAAKDGIYSAAVTVKNGRSGPAAVHVTATDRVPHTSAPVSIAVNVDNTAPKVTGVTDSDPDHVYANGQAVRLTALLDGPGYSVTADFSALDNRFVPGAEAVQVRGDTALIAYVLNGGNGIADGSYPVTVTATDAVGLSGTGRVKVTLDNSGPVTELKLDDGDGIINAPATVAVTAKDDRQAVETVRFAVDAMPGDGISGSVAVKDGAVKLDPATLAQGAHAVYVQARNAAGTWGACAVQPFTVDTRAPEAGPVTVTCPDNRNIAGAGQQVVVAVRLTDTDAGLDPEKLYLNASAFGGGKKDRLTDDGTAGDAVAGDNVYSAAVTVKAKKGGALPFSITAADRVSNTVELKGTVNIDPAAPELKLATDKTGDKLKGKVTEPALVLSGSYKDDDITDVTVEHTVAGAARPGTPVAVPPAASKSFSLPLALVPGDNTVTVTARDRAGNVTVESGVFTYEVPQAK